MGPGRQGPVVSSEFGALGKSTQHSSWEMWAGSARGASASQPELRGGLETVGHEPRLSLALASVSMAANRFRLRRRTLPENRAASRTALKRSETAVLRRSRFSVMMPLSMVRWVI